MNSSPPVDCSLAGTSSSVLIPLERLASGQRAVVQRIEGRAADAHRLAEFGLRLGTTIEMFRPGKTCILRLGGSKVCVRANGSITIFVAPIDPPG